MGGSTASTTSSGASCVRRVHIGAKVFHEIFNGGQPAGRRSDVVIAVNVGEDLDARTQQDLASGLGISLQLISIIVAPNAQLVCNRTPAPVAPTG